jgi:hypothetical protein
MCLMGLKKYLKNHNSLILVLRSMILKKTASPEAVLFLFDREIFLLDLLHDVTVLADDLFHPPLRIARL